jgi:hypothetical protein
MGDPFPKLDVPRKLELTGTQRLTTMLGPRSTESVDPRRILALSRPSTGTSAGEE